MLWCRKCRKPSHLQGKRRRGVAASVAAACDTMFHLKNRGLSLEVLWCRKCRSKFHPSRVRVRASMRCDTATLRHFQYNHMQ